STRSLLSSVSVVYRPRCASLSSNAIKPSALTALEERRRRDPMIQASAAGVLRRFMICILFAGIASPISAQEFRPTLHGKILDPSNAAVAGAAITAMSNGRAEATALSDQDGRFSLALPQGKHTIRITAPGFSEIAEAVDLTQTTDPPERSFVLRLPEVRQIV